MSAILYIARRQTVNRFRCLLRKPGRLMIYLLSFAMIAWMLIGLPKHSGSRLDPRLLQGGYLLWLLLLGTLTAWSSMERGTALFRLPDVNLLFVSPLSSRAVLAYGLIRRTGKTLSGFLFLLFYSGMLIDSFGISPAGVAILIAGTVLYLTFVQILTLALYGFAGNSRVRLAWVKAGILSVPALFLISALLLFQRGGATREALEAAFASPVLEAVPGAGWVKGAAFALMAGNARAAVPGATLLAGSLGLALLLFLKTDADYYEDMLPGAESNGAQRHSGRAKRFGRHAVSPEKEGLRTGRGANAFFFKHLCEARNRGRFFSAGASAVFLILLNLAVAGGMVLIGKSHSSPVPADAVLLTGCGISVYILFFRSASGDWMRELRSPYLYLIPESPLRKLLWACATTALRPALDGLAAFSVLGLVLRADPAAAAACALVYGGFGVLSTAGTVLGVRVLGTVPNRGAPMMLYLLLLLAVTAPGIAGSVLAAYMLRAVSGTAILAASLPCVFWNLFAAFTIFYLCRNILENAELERIGE